MPEETDGPRAGQLEHHRIHIGKVIDDDDRAARGGDMLPAPGADPVKEHGDDRGNRFPEYWQIGTPGAKRGDHVR